MLFSPILAKPAHLVGRLALLTFAALTTLAVEPLVTSQRVQAQDLGIAVGEVAPGGPLETLDGKAVDLSSYLGSATTIIEFWATWCPNCKQLEPSLRAALSKHPTVKLVTVAVSVNQSIERVRAWQKQNNMPGDILYDRKGTVSGAYDVPATSYVVVVSAKGRIVYTGVGGTQDIESAIKRAM